MSFDPLWRLARASIRGKRLTMKQPESPLDVKLYEFGRMLDDVLDASHECEIAADPYHARAYAAYKASRERLMGAIAAALQDKFDLGYTAAGGSIHEIKSVPAAESTMEHIARDIRDGIFPKRS